MKQIVSTCADMSKDTWIDRGVHRNSDERNKYAGEPVALDFGIKVKYDPSDEYEPWRYEILTPQGNSFYSFLTSIDIEVGVGNIINGGNARFITSEQAEDAAVSYAKSIAKRYKQYLDGQKKAKDYTLTVPLDTDDDKE